MATLWQKEQICKAWDEIKASGVKNPSKVLEDRKLPGFFVGCIYESKWGRVRVQQQWTLVCAAAPQLCKRHKELPNSLRVIMKLPEKHTVSDTDDLASQASMPFPLKCVVESIIMEKIQHGQEVTMTFVKNTIVFCCDLWNECVHTIRGSVQEKSLDMLREHDEKYAVMPADELNAVFEDISKAVSGMLVTIHISRSEAALR